MGLGIAAVVIAAAALFLKNSISLIMVVTAIQLAYMGIVSISGQHPITHSLAQGLHAILGYNYDEFSGTENNDL